MDGYPAGVAKLGAFTAFAAHPLRISEQQHRIDRLNACRRRREQAHEARQAKDFEQVTAIIPDPPGAECGSHIEAAAASADSDHSRTLRDVARIESALGRLNNRKKFDATSRMPVILLESCKQRV